MAGKETIREACLQASSLFVEHDVLEPRANAERLLMHLLGLEDRSRLLLCWNEPFPDGHAGQWQEMVARKAAGEPAQYITGEEWFYGRRFRVTPAVLIPRPETELLVEAIIHEMAAYAQQPDLRSELQAGQVGEQELGQGQQAEHGMMQEPMQGQEQEQEQEQQAGATRGIAEHSEEPVRLSIADIGTGSGAIAVTLALELQQLALQQQKRGERPIGAGVAAVDISGDALQVARSNAASLGVEEAIAFEQGDLLEPLFGRRVDVLVSNPPYIPAADLPGLQREVREHEPMLALDGGHDGLEPYRRIVDQLPRLANMPAIIGFEVGIHQAGDVAGLLQAAGYSTRIVPDYAGIERHVIGRRS